jgi:hypothetical protein
MSEKAIAVIKIAISVGLIVWTFSREPLAVVDNWRQSATPT